jgi:hypothetical protein
MCIWPQQATHILFNLCGMQPDFDITFGYRSDYCPENSGGTPTIGSGRSFYYSHLVCLGSRLVLSSGVSIPYAPCLVNFPTFRQFFSVWKGPVRSLRLSPRILGWFIIH